MTARDFLAAVGAIALLRVTWVAVANRIAATRAQIAADRIGRTYWSANLVFTLPRGNAATLFHPAAGSAVSVAQRLPRGWVTPGERLGVGAFLFWIGLGVVLAIALQACLAISTAHADCGEERAPVKLGTDADARKVALQPVPATIAELVLRPAPHPLPEDHRVRDERGTERTVYAIHATIAGYKLEADGDFHVVIADEHGQTIIVEIPAPDCARPGAWGEQVVAARGAFLALLAARHLPRPAAKLHRAHVEASIAGVGFYDRIHGQTGVARNGIELHPVLAVESGGGS